MNARGSNGKRPRSQSLLDPLSYPGIIQFGVCSKKLVRTVRKAKSAVSNMVEEIAPLRSPGFTDPGWEHGIALDEKRKKVKCNYCGKIVSGGIYRLKQHLARISGEVTYCKKAPEEVFIKMKENLVRYKSRYRKRQLEDEEQYFDFHYNHDTEEGQESVGYKQKGREDRVSRSSITSIAPLRSLGYVDPGWEHCVAQDEKKKKVKCNYCEKVVSGGINRFKQHLARIPGEVACCKMVPEEVYLKMTENMKWHRSGRRQTPETMEDSLFMHADDQDEDEHGHTHDRVKAIRTIDDRDVSTSRTIQTRSRGKSRGSVTSCAEQHPKQILLDSVLSNTQKIHPSISYKLSKQKRSSNKRSSREILSAICRFFYYAAIPSKVADSPYFHKMLDLVSRQGHGFGNPTSELISGQFLQDEVQTAKEYLMEIKASWATTGCSIMVDSWKNVQGKIIINFLVSCPRGTYFMSSVDASDAVKDASCLFKLLDHVVEEVGEGNVVQVITENTSYYRAAGKLLEEKRKNLFWTPCAAYCIDRIIEDFTKFKWIRECLDNGQKITRLIYNHIWLLNLMKKEYTAGKELLKPSDTRFTTGFLSLQCLLNHRPALKRMFLSSKWISSELAKSDEGKEVEKVIFNSTFWKKMQYISKSVDPVVQLLARRVGSNPNLSMPSIYNDIHSAKLAIKAVHADDERKYGPFWHVIDDHFSSVFHHPLFVAAYFLNPSYRYRPDFMAVPEVIRGLNECITRLESDTGRRISAATQISDFVYAKADFGTELALSTRMDLDPAAWWQQHGINCLELQRIAVRILSQSCTSFGCEHNWSTFDCFHSTTHSRLVQKRMNDFAFVHYNLRLRERERQLKRSADESTSLDSVFLESLLGNWIVNTDQPAFREAEDVPYHDEQQAEAYGNDEVIRNEDFDGRPKKALIDDVAMPESFQPSGAHPGGEGGAADEDEADLDFLDDHLDD